MPYKSRAIFLNLLIAFTFLSFPSQSFAHEIPKTENSLHHTQECNSWCLAKKAALKLIVPTGIILTGIWENEVLKDWWSKKPQTQTEMRNGARDEATASPRAAPKREEPRPSSGNLLQAAQFRFSSAGAFIGETYAPVADASESSRTATEAREPSYQTVMRTEEALKALESSDEEDEQSIEEEPSESSDEQDEEPALQPGPPVSPLLTSPALSPRESEETRPRGEVKPKRKLSLKKKIIKIFSGSKPKDEDKGKEKESKSGSTSPSDEEKQEEPLDLDTRVFLEHEERLIRQRIPDDTLESTLTGVAHILVEAAGYDYGAVRSMIIRVMEARKLAKPTKDSVLKQIDDNLKPSPSYY